MKAGTLRVVRLALLLILAASLQGLYGSGIAIKGARPDIVLLIALLSAQFYGACAGAGIGCCAGLMTASCVAPPPHFDGYGSIVVSRTLVCFLVGALEETVFRDNILIAVTTVTVGTIVTEVLFFVFDPHFRVSTWAHACLTESVYNGALSVPIYFVVRKCLKSKDPVVSLG